MDMLLDNSINLMWSFFAVQSAMNGIARELVFAGVDTVVHERLGPPTTIGGVASAVAGHAPAPVSPPESSNGLVNAATSLNALSTIPTEALASALASEPHPVVEVEDPSEWSVDDASMDERDTSDGEAAEHDGKDTHLRLSPYSQPQP